METEDGTEAALPSEVWGALESKGSQVAFRFPFPSPAEQPSWPEDRTHETEGVGITEARGIASFQWPSV